MHIALKESRLGLRNSTTRLPFRYGNACLTRCPQAVLQATVEVEGRITAGYSGDCLPPGWFDKSPEKDYARQIDEMLAAIACAERVFRDAFARPTAFFHAWLGAHHQVHAEGTRRQWTPLLASFGVSMVERAIIDAVARALRVSFHQLARENHLGLAPGEIHSELAGYQIGQWLPERPAAAIAVRHTVGLADPLTAADIRPDERLDDGFPQSLEEYLAETGIRYLKIKVANRLDQDTQRLREIAALAERYRGADYRVTLDGNEQYERAEQLEELLDGLRRHPQTANLLANTLAIEQPVARQHSFQAAQTAGIGRLAEELPVIIDESDGQLDSYAHAIEVGYRGVSTKNCKGPIKSLLNCGLTWLHNDLGQRNAYVMTAEDLCSVGVVPVQADLCLCAALGLKHVERNGHHYHPGLTYLSEAEQQAALAAHGDLYARRHGRVSPEVVDGQFRIGSLACDGFGFRCLPDMTVMQRPEEWTYASLGL